MDTNSSDRSETNFDVSLVRKRVEAALERVRPALQADGGDAEIIEISPSGVVTLQLVGACGGCAMSNMTLRHGIERVIKSEVPEVTSVEALSLE